MIVVADSSKLVDRLGRFPLPAEVALFGHSTTARRIAEAAARLGYPGPRPSLRTIGDAPVVTDSGNVIYDCAFVSIADARALAASLSGIPGVVDHGLFIGLCSALVIAGADGVSVIEA
ncbi:MAG TPA: ribose-5-phosphate isomerase A, partial [Rhizomicrobium sp.]|jgi:ribose 5-phosphate isomerase A|nr:ribose-5-phosphate isomerase A [Rhizomicrobium sp.]